MTYYGSQMVVENYNLMGAGEGGARVRHPLPRGRARAQGHPRACDLARAARRPAPPPASPEFDELLEKAQDKAPTRSLVTIDDVGAATAFLAHRRRQADHRRDPLHRRRLSHHRLIPLAVAAARS